MNGLVETLRTLVDIRSETGSEAQICTYLEERLAASGLPRKRIGNSLVVGRPQPGEAFVTLYGHIDTVPHQGQPAAYIEDGVLFGLGSSDMKAGVAVMIHLLEDGDVAGGGCSLVAVFYDREEGPAAENGLIRVLAEADWLTKSEFGVVLEPTDLHLELGCQGVVNATVSFLGKSAHSARPWLGENAVTRGGAWLESLHRREPNDVEHGGLVFREVFSITTAHGGVSRNVVPPRFDLNLNYRFPPTLTVDEAVARLRGIAAPADEVEIVDTAPAAPVPAGNPYLDKLAEVTSAQPRPKQAWTDVARLGKAGVPAVNFGPGMTALAHQVEESVPLDNLAAGFSTLKRFLSGQVSPA